MTSTKETNFDAVVIGAGFSGMYMLYRLRELGLSTRVYEAADGVGGTWYWNRYPGARCDSESIYYNYTFSEELYREWTWSSRYPEQPEILKYLNFVADKFELRPDIQFNTRVNAALQKTSKENIITPDIGHIQKLISLVKQSVLLGLVRAAFRRFLLLRREATHLTVFQRTPQYSAPVRNHPYDPEYFRQAKENFQEIKRQMRESTGGAPGDIPTKSALEVTPEERLEKYEEAWRIGGQGIFTSYYDITVNEEANKTASEFIRSKIQEIVKKQDVAEKLMPTYYYGTKRPIIDTDYYETYNRDNVSLVDVKKNPIVEITEKGLRTTEGEFDVDVLVFATGFDGMTGPLLKMDIRGKDGVSLKEKWNGGENTRTYLGVAIAGFPNFFMITGPESPSVLSNMPVSIEQHVEWISDCIEYMCENNMESIEANVEAEEAWSKHCGEVANATLFSKADSWYTGANIPGKTRRFLIYLGGVGAYRQKCAEIAANGYEGFHFEKAPAPIQGSIK